MAEYRNETHGSGSLTISVRQLEIYDVDAIVEIEKSCFSHPWSRESFSSLVEKSAFKAFGAFINESTLGGYVILSIAAKELHILNIAVHNEYRKHGLGTRLLQYAHDMALKKKCVESFLEVRESNMDAQSLYKKLGYTKLGRRLEYYSDTKEDAILMASKLKKR